MSDEYVVIPTDKFKEYVDTLDQLVNKARLVIYYGDIDSATVAKAEETIHAMDKLYYKAVGH